MEFIQPVLHIGLPKTKGHIDSPPWFEGKIFLDCLHLYINFSALLSPPDSLSRACIIFSTVTFPRVVGTAKRRDCGLLWTSVSLLKLRRVLYSSLYPASSLSQGSATISLKNEKEILVRSLHLPPVPYSLTSSGYSLDTVCPSAEMSSVIIVSGGAVLGKSTWNG